MWTYPIYQYTKLKPVNCFLLNFAPGDDLKLPSAKPRENYLKKYARKLGVNDRGCYIACGLAVLAFLLFIVIIAMASAWPGE